MACSKEHFAKKVPSKVLHIRSPDTKQRYMYFIGPNSEVIRNIQLLEHYLGHRLPIVLGRKSLERKLWKGKKADDQQKEQVEIEDENEAKVYQGRVLVRYHGRGRKRKVLPAGWTSGRFHTSGPKFTERLFISPTNQRFTTIPKVEAEVGYTLPIVASVDSVTKKWKGRKAHR